MYEPRDGWSLREPAARARRARRSRRSARAYPALREPIATTSTTLDLDEALDGADLVLVHEWNDHELVARDRRASRARRGATGCCSTTRTTASVTDPARWRATTCAHYDGVLAFGDVIRDLYLRARLGARAPGRGTRRPTRASSGRCAGASRARATWSGSATGATTSARAELRRVPARAGASARADGARPRRALSRRGARARSRAAGIDYGGWLPNYRRAGGVRALPGHRARAAPAVRRGAAGHPDDPRLRGAGLRHPAGLARRGTTSRGCSRPGDDLPRRARRRRDDARTCAALLARSRRSRARWRAHGRATILARHTCAHRVDELLRDRRASSATRRHGRTEIAA